MNTTEEDLDTALRELADSEPVTPAPVEELLDRGRRRRRQVGMSAAALGAVAAVAVGLVGAGMIGGEPGPSTPAAAPLVISAAEATGQTSFRLVATVRTKTHTFRQEGAYDPVTRKGYLLFTDESGNTHEQRIIGDDRYILPSTGPQNQPAPNRRGFAFGMATGIDPELTVDVAELLAKLRSDGTVRDLGNGRYSFNSTGNSDTSGPVSGVVDVDAASGHVARVIYQLSGDCVLTLEFSDYGKPVEVERP